MMGYPKRQLVPRSLVCGQKTCFFVITLARGARLSFLRDPNGVRGKAVRQHGSVPVHGAKNGTGILRLRDGASRVFIANLRTGPGRFPRARPI